ncbi:uncharacterized protein LOC143226774 [Tachypleus tridentatus]|uniref:uncharacterized protein LOC143226774 n=1 Tax=Tachypleus tridentatus TaxID=6853 RepID=UPI003FD247B4
MATAMENGQNKRDEALCMDDVQFKQEANDTFSQLSNSRTQSAEEERQTKDPDFMEVPLNTTQQGERKKKLPKRILHFSDGILEEYSTDEEEVQDNTDSTALLDTKQMAWMPYLWYMTWWIGCRALAGCDFVGEKLAHLFGITTPKYQYELEEYQRMLKEEEEEKEKTTEENVGWKQEKDQLRSVKVEPSVKTSLENVQSPASSVGDSVAVKPDILSMPGEKIQMATTETSPQPHVNIPGITTSQLCDDTSTIMLETKSGVTMIGSITKSSAPDLEPQ